MDFIWCMKWNCWWYFLDELYFILRDHEVSFMEVHPSSKDIGLFWSPFLKFDSLRKLGSLLLRGRHLGQKRNTFQAFGQPVKFSNLGSVVDLTSWQCSTGNVELGQLDNVEMTIFLCANWWNGCELWSLAKWTWQKCEDK